MRTIGLDVGRWSASVAIHEPGRATRSAGKFPLDPDHLRAFAASLGPDDEVVLEASTNTWAIADLLAQHAGRVVVSNPIRTRAIAAAKVKTDTIDAATLADLLAADYLPEVWQPDAVTRSLRRRVNQRAALVKERSRHRNRVSAVLARNLLACPWTDPFGVAGRKWLASVVVPADERLALDASLRLLAALTAEITATETEIARLLLDDARVRRLMTIPGVGFLTAATLVAVIGDVSRFPRPNKLVSYLGLEPRVRQSGSRPAWIGHISHAGSSRARALLVEAAHAAIRTPGPLHAFHARLIRRRKRAGVALVAVARKLAVLAWHVLTDDTDYRWARPTLVARKVRRVELQAGLPRQCPQPSPSTKARQAARAIEAAALERAEAAYVAFVAAHSTRADTPAAKRGATQDGQRPAARRGSSPQPPHFATGSGVSGPSIPLEDDAPKPRA